MSRNVMPERVDAGDRGRHLVDDALHPQTDQLRLVGIEVRTTADRRGVRRQRPVTQPDQLGPLVGECREQRPDLLEGGIRAVDVEERGHRTDSSPGCSSALSTSRNGIAVAYHRPQGGASLDLGLDGARALVGGGSSGLGLAVGTVLAGEGARVALAARPSDRLEMAAGSVDGSVAIGVDLESVDGPASAVQRTVEALGGLDAVLVNSGGPPPGGFDKLDEATWDRAIEGTLLGAVRLIRAALPHLRHSDRPAILLILSSSAREPIPGLTASNTIRPGLAGLIKSLGAEIAPIRINGLAPGRFTTPRNTEVEQATAARTGQTTEEIRAGTVSRIPLGRLGDPIELGRVGAFLLSPAASFVTGAIVPVDGGMVKSLP